MNTILKHIKKWADVYIMLPVFLGLVIFNAPVIRFFDPTADVLDGGFVAILYLNCLIFLAINIFSYFIWQNYFRADIFDDTFWSRLQPYQQAKLSIFLWVITLIVSGLVLSRHILW